MGRGRLLRLGEMSEDYAEPLHRDFTGSRAESLSLCKHWLGREDSNLRMAESKSAALPLGYAPNALAG